jgi:hypothetical protein
MDSRGDADETSGRLVNEWMRRRLNKKAGFRNKPRREAIGYVEA